MSRQPLTNALLRYLRRRLDTDVQADALASQAEELSALLTDLAALKGSYDANMPAIQAAINGHGSALDALAESQVALAEKERADAETASAGLDERAKAVIALRADLNSLRDSLAMHRHGDMEKQIAQLLWRPPIPEHTHPLPAHDHSLPPHDHDFPPHEHDFDSAVHEGHGHHWNFSSTDNMNGRTRRIYKCEDCGIVEAHVVKGG